MQIEVGRKEKEGGRKEGGRDGRGKKGGEPCRYWQEMNEAGLQR